MSEYTVNGAMLVCTCGTMPTPLQVTGNCLLSVQGQNVATVSDKVPMVNIKPFGPCKMKPTVFGYAPCVPVPVAWTGFLTSVQVPGGNPLLKTSTIPCGCGGVISFQDSGQKKPDKVVLNPTSPQIEALEQAALNVIPFCEECVKKKTEVKPKIINIFWIDEGSDEPHELSELQEGKEVTLCVEVEEGGAGKTVDAVIKSDGQHLFKGNKQEIEYKGVKIDDDNTAYIDKFMIEYEQTI